jgi:photosystem II stability/assembly factor-like uncharacterized protein
LKTVFFISTTQGWAGGLAGTILVTSNGGTTWTPQTSSTTQIISSIHFTDANNGWVAGSSAPAQGFILNTSNGGATWTPQTSPTAQNLSSINFTSSSIGWASGAGGTLLHTVNGGTTWTSQTSPATHVWRSIMFPSPLIGWAVGDSGAVVNTINGGTTWTVQPTFIISWMRCVYFVNNFAGWTVGDNGTILRYSSPGAIHENENALSLNSYPNPSAGNFAINLNASSEQTVHISVTDVFGKVISEQDVNVSVGENNLDMELPESCVNGIYMVSVNGLDFRRTGRLILQR